MSHQLPLPIHQPDDAALENFHIGDNCLLMDSLRKHILQPKQPPFYLWGETGSGKSHLLKAVTHYFLGQNRTALYVPLEQSNELSPAVLERLERQDAVCLDDLQAIIGRREWEVAVFDLINRIKETGNILLLISADQSPHALAPLLPDLASRLAWGEIYQLHPLNETQKLAVLQQNARQRGIELPDDTAAFLLKRLERDMHTLFNALVQLDKASLQAQRRLTIPFVKAVLGL